MKKSSSKQETEWRFYSVIRKSTDTPVEIQLIEGESLPSTWNTLDWNVPGTYAGIAKLSSQGEIVPVQSLAPKKETAKQQQQRFLTMNEGRNLIATQYRTEFPKESKYLDKFVKDVVANLSETSEIPSSVADGIINVNTSQGQKAITELLTTVLKTQEDNLFKTGKTEQMFGWILPNGVMTFVPGGLGTAKYPQARAISEVAEKANASHIIFVGETWIRDKNNDRNGQEGLHAMVVLSNGDVLTSASSVYQRKPGRKPSFKVIQPVTTEKTKGEYMKQYLFPAWKHVPANTVAA